MAQDDFDTEAYYDSLAETMLDTFPHYYNKPSYDAHDALSEAVFEVADQYLAYKSGEEAIKVLEASQNEPDEWQPFAEGKDDWEEVIIGMAFTVVRQDVYDALEERGYLDNHWNVTDKLTEVEA